MPDEIRVNKPMQSTSGRMMSEDMSGMQSRRGGSKMPWVVLVIVIALLGAGLFLFRDKIFSKAGGGDVKGAVTGKASGYQAVFLTNGQVYFGKVSDKTSAYVRLTDIYYLQVTQPPLQGSQSQTQQQQQQQQPQISLVKLGKELHGPDDKMDINKDQILFIEDMMDDAKVVQAIREYKANPNGSNSQAPAAQGGAGQSLGGQQTQVQGATTNTPAGGGVQNTPSTRQSQSNQ